MLTIRDVSWRELLAIPLSRANRFQHRITNHVQFVLTGLELSFYQALRRIFRLLRKTVNLLLSNNQMTKNRLANQSLRSTRLGVRKNQFDETQTRNENPMIDYTTRRVSDAITVVEVSGMLNESNRKYFFSCIGDMIESGSRYIIIECHRLGYLNTAALASFLTARKHAARKGGRIYLTHLSSNMAEVLEITKLGRLLSVYPSTEAALGNIRSTALAG